MLLFQIEAVSDGHGIMHKIDDETGNGSKNLSQRSEGRSNIRALGKAIHSNIKNRIALPTFEKYPMKVYCRTECIN